MHSHISLLPFSGILLIALLWTFSCKASTRLQKQADHDTPCFRVQIKVKSDGYAKKAVAVARIEVKAAKAKTLTDNEGMTEICVPNTLKDTAIYISIRCKGYKRYSTTTLFGPGQEQVYFLIRHLKFRGKKRHFPFPGY